MEQAMPDEEKDRVVGLIASLVDNVAFRALHNTILAQIELRKKKVQTRISTPEEMAMHNQLIGEIDGMFTAIQYPKLIHDKLKDDETMKNIEKEGL
jgi:hypothetical protein